MVVEKSDALSLSKGYKQTEIGVIPQDWEVGKMSDCLKNKPDYGIGAAAVKYNDNLFTYLRITDIQEDGKFDKTNLASVDNVNAKKYLLNNDELVVARTGASVGKSYLYDNRDGEMVFAGFLIRLKPDLTKISSKYLFAITQTKYYKSWIVNNSMRSGQPGINSNQLNNLLIPLPPLPEQTAIANALSDMDALIAQTEKLIEKKKAIKQGVMQELLKPKEGWVRKKLGEVCTMFSGGTPSTEDASYYGGNINWIVSGDLNKFVIHEVDGKITDLGLANSSAKLIEPNTILLAMYGATAGVSAMSKIHGAINQAILAMIPLKGYSMEFLFYCLTFYKEWIITTYTQGGQPNLSGNIIKSIEISFPNEEEQIKIAEIITDIVSEIIKFETKLQKLQNQKQGMMQALLTGKIRLV
jgi:type I restriction enzyme, S subunit